MTVLRFPRDRYTVSPTAADSLVVYCETCPGGVKVYEARDLTPFEDLADAVYIHERSFHGG